MKPVKTILEVQPLEPIHVHTDGLLLPAVRKRFARHEERGLERMRVGLAILDSDAHVSLIVQRYGRSVAIRIILQQTTDRSSPHA